MTDAHDLLPWYINGTLDPRERQTFQDHLRACAQCAEELPVLEDLRRRAGESGWAEHAEHPDPEDLSRAVAEGIDEPAIRLHLALCLTCAQEARWLSGDEAAEAEPGLPHAGRARGTAPSVPARVGSPADAVRPRIGWAAPLAAAAAVVVLLLAGSMLIPWRSAGPVRSVSAPIFVPATERAPGRRHEVALPAGVPLQLHFEADLGPESFPAAFEIRDASGRAVTKDEVRAADLFRGIFVLNRPRAEYPDGDYMARLTPAGGHPPVDYPFRIITSR